MGKALPPPSVQTAFGKMVATTPLIDGLELSPLCWNDFGELHRLLNESDVFHRCTGDIPFPYTREALEAWMFQTREVPCRDSGRIGWAVRDRSRRLIGEVSLLSLGHGQQA
ncbi:MAG: GNAT family N-acetyltransferase, partial [Planctomycetota bacterium]